MEVHHVYQEHEAYCGPAVAQMVLKHFGVEMTQQEIAKELETDMVVGTSASELEKFFTKRGFAVERKNDASWAELSNVVEQKTAIIGYIERDGDPHYALVRRVGDTDIVLADPWHGDSYVLAKAEFEERWVDNEHARYGNRMFMTVTQKS